MEVSGRPKSGNTAHLVIFLAEGHQSSSQQSRVYERQEVVVVGACGGTCYRFERDLRIVQQFYKHHLSCFSSNNCVKSSRTFDVGPDARQLADIEKNGRYDGPKMTSQLSVLPCPQGNSL